MNRIIRMTISVLGVIVFMTFTSCEKINVPDGTPNCIKKKIRQIKSNGVANPPSSVWKYNYHGETVYYIPPRCCDIGSQLYDNNCNQICSPDGGNSGGGDGKCPDFFTDRTNGELIWQDDRK